MKLTSPYKSALSRAIEPFAAGVSRLGISPTAITLSTPILTGLVCLWFARTRAVVPFCVAMLAVGCLDVLDGAVARVSGRVTKLGAYLDAICDRYVEAIVVLTVAWVSGYWGLSVVVLAGAQLVSYAKARAAMEVPVSNQEWPDLMERGERSLLFLTGLVAGEVIPWRPFGKDLFWWTLAAIAVLVHATVLQRVWRARRFILERGRR